jgi:hypothetical protein
LEPCHRCFDVVRKAMSEGRRNEVQRETAVSNVEHKRQDRRYTREVCEFSSPFPHQISEMTWKTVLTECKKNLVMKRLTFVLQLICEYVCKRRLDLSSCKRTPEMKPLIYCNEALTAVSPRVSLIPVYGTSDASLTRQLAMRNPLDQKNDATFFCSIQLLLYRSRDLKFSSELF